MSRTAVATIHLAALRENLARIRALAPASRVMAVVKADGYGHGLERVARALAGADAYGVASIADGQRLRAAGISQRIVVLSGVDAAGDLPEARRLMLDVVVHHESQFHLIKADADPRRLRVWLKLDTGMHRLGIAPQKALTLYSALRALPNVDPEIVSMSHFASSDDIRSVQTEAQMSVFRSAVKDLSKIHSIANSAAVLLHPAAHMQWLRTGGLLYGMSVIAGKPASDFGFHPAMSLSSKIIAINRIAKGEYIGYGASWQCPEEMDIGIVAMGYGDGYPRHARAGTPVLLRSGEASIVGRVSMDLLTIDLRRHPAAAIGDRVLLWGRGLPVERIAECADTIAYELTCGVTRRVMFLEDDDMTSGGWADDL